jgi:putative ABC transport system substrate-binding protein
MREAMPAQGRVGAVTRRDVLAGGVLAGGAALRGAPARAQAQRPRIGILTPAAEQFDSDAFTDGLREAGFVAGESVALDMRSADGALDRLPALARDLVAVNADVIVAINSPGVAAAIAATPTIPIVFAAVANPVLLGFVDSYARPGRNVTGISNMGDEIGLKRLELLRQAAPEATRILATYHPDDPITAPQLAALAASAGSLGAVCLPVAVRTVEDLDAAFAQGAAWGANGLLRIVGQGMTTAAAAAQRALQRRMPGMFSGRREVEGGGLISYFAENRDIFRRAAVPVARILRGERAADLPVERPTKFDLAVNLRTARAIGVTVPPSLLLLADAVIE